MDDCADPHAHQDIGEHFFEGGHDLLSLIHIYVTDFTQIAAYGVMTTPALVVDGKVVSYGKVLKKDEAKALIQKARG